MHLQMAILSLFFSTPKRASGVTLPLIIIAVFDHLGLAGDTRLLQAYIYIYRRHLTFAKVAQILIYSTPRRNTTTANGRYQTSKSEASRGGSFEFSPIRIFQKRFPYGIHQMYPNPHHGVLDLPTFSTSITVGILLPQSVVVFLQRVKFI